MEIDPRTEPLRRWNELARENTEVAMVSSMYDAVLGASAPLEKFATWLLAGTAAVAAFFLINALSLLPHLSKTGFAICAALLCLSGACGLIAKIYSMYCEIGISGAAAGKKTFLEHLTAYSEEERQIQEGARFWGVDIQSGVRIDKIISDFVKPFNPIVRWKVKKILSENQNDPHIGHLSNLSYFQIQALFTGLSAFLLLAFLATGFYFAVVNFS